MDTGAGTQHVPREGGTEADDNNHGSERYKKFSREGEYTGSDDDSHKRSRKGDRENSDGPAGANKSTSTGDLVEYSTVRLEDLAHVINPDQCIICARSCTHICVSLRTRNRTRICPACEDSLDPALQFLHENVMRIYEFWIWLREKQLCDTFCELDVPNKPTVFAHEFGEPQERTELPKVRSVRVYDNDGNLVVKELDEAERRLLKEVMLVDLQCHFAIVLLADILRQVFMDDPGSPVRNIEEVYLVPNHERCTGHWIHRFTLKDGRQFAVSFTDRQLGWYRLIVPWREYEELRIKKMDPFEELGSLRGEPEDPGFEVDRNSNDGSYAAMNELRWRRYVAEGVPAKVVEDWQAWGSRGSDCNT